MRSFVARIRERLDVSLWVVPSVCLAASAGLSVAAETIDRQLSSADQAWYLFQGGPAGARALLSAVGSSMMTFTGVVFSVTILVLQLASNQFSPRVMRSFLRDRGTQVVLGIFVGTFLYSLLGLRSVRTSFAGAKAYVPALTVWLAVVLAVGCIVSFVYFLHHVAQSIRAVNVLARIGDEGREQLQKLYPDDLGESDDELPASKPAGLPGSRIVFEGLSGVVVTVDAEALWTLATEANVTLALVPSVGDFVPTGSTLCEVWGDPARLDGEAVIDAVNIGRERSMREDVGFAFRQLVDVAERALSPGINDPTTAVQALDQLHDLLRRLVCRKIPSARRIDAQGQLRLFLPRPDWSAYVAMALDEIREAGAGQMQIARRLRFLLEDLIAAAPPSRLPALERQRGLLDESVRRDFADAADRAVAGTASAQGHGA